MKILFALFILFSSCQQARNYYVIAKDPTWLAIHDSSILGPLNTFLNAFIIEISKKEKFKVNVIDINEFELYQGLEGESYQGIFSTLSPNDMSAELYDFSLPILAIGPVLIVRKDEAVTKLDDLAEKIIGVPTYGPAIYLVQKVSGVVIREYETIALALDDLKLRQIDGVVMGTLLATSLINKYEDLKIVTAPLTNDAIRFLVLKGKNQGLLKVVNQNLERVGKNSKFQKLQEKFFLSLRQIAERTHVILQSVFLCSPHF